MRVKGQDHSFEEQRTRKCVQEREIFIASDMYQEKIINEKGKACFHFQIGTAKEIAR